MNDILTTKEGDDVFFIKKNFYSQDLIRETSKGFFQFFGDKINSIYSACRTTITTIWNLLLLAIFILIAYKFVIWYKSKNFSIFSRMFSMIKSKKAKPKVSYKNTTEEVKMQPKVLYYNIPEEVNMQPKLSYNNTTEEVKMQPNVFVHNIPEEVNIQPKVSYNNITKEVKLQPMALYNDHTNDIDIQAII